MFTFIKKLFRKEAPKPIVPRVIARAVPATPPDSSQPRPQVEVAHLSLAAILSRFPEDLKRNVAALPDPSVTVALPIATIHKQLATGSVKMSLASLYRQAPVGVFASQGRLEEKRMIEVPLSEIFRHVKPQGLRRRNDQRRVDLPDDAYELFGDKENPYAISPAAHGPAEEEYEEAAVEEEAPAPAPRGIKPTNDLPGTAPDTFVPAPPPGVNAGGRGKGKQSPASKAAPQSVPPANNNKASAPPPAAEPPVVIPVAGLCSGWPEPIRSEVLAMEDATVSLPVAAVTSGVAKGKVIFSWGQIRSWLTPPPSSPTQGREATDLLLPLKVVAPAFLAHSRPTTAKKKVQLDESIPALFSGGEAAKPAAAPVPAPAPAAPESIPAPASLPPPVVEPAAKAAKPEPAPAPSSAPAPAPAAVDGPKSIAEILGEEKAQWSPHDLVKAALFLPGVSGAIIGLNEGLVVAAELPAHLKGDTIAAFLPQMFARLNNYTGEMQLGQVSELLFTTKETAFQSYKAGEVYLAVLAKPGDVLPTESLRLITDELARQNSK